MNSVTSPIRSSFAGLSRSVALAALIAVSVCSVSQDKRKAANTNAGSDEDEIKQLISMYAKAADEADPTLASRIWCDSSEDSLINPVGRWHGVEQIMGFYRHDMGEMYSLRDLKISEFPFRCTRMRRGQNSTGISQPSEEKKDRQFHSVAWKPRFIARTATGGVWFMFIIPRCPLKRRPEQNESVRVYVSLRSYRAL